MNLDLFTKGYCKFATPQSFIDSEVGQYLAAVYGPLHFTKNPTVNFLNVHIENASYIISEGIWIDKFPNISQKYSIIPERFINEQYKTNYTGGDSNSISESLSKFGLAFVSQETPKDETDSIIDIDFTEKIAGGVHTPLEYEAERSKHANTEHVIQEIVPFIERWHLKTCKDISSNILIKKMIHGGHVQKMTKGPGLSPHTDADRGEPFMLSKLHWIFDSSQEIKGRRLGFGSRTEKDLARFIKQVLESNDDSASHTPISELKQKGSLAPCQLTKVYISCWNPMHYHDVSPMESETEVVTVIEDYSVTECT
jgi:hypothetical protein